MNRRTALTLLGSALITASVGRTAQAAGSVAFGPRRKAFTIRAHSPLELLRYVEVEAQGGSVVLCDDDTQKWLIRFLVEGRDGFDTPYELRIGDACDRKRWGKGDNTAFAKMPRVLTAFRGMTGRQAIARCFSEGFTLAQMNDVLPSRLGQARDFLA